MNRNAEVDAWLAAYDNPMKPVVMAMRAVILGADPRIGETIKWQAPTFTYKGNMASFFPRAKKHASLMFHTGQSIPGDFSSLETGARFAATLKIASLYDLEGKKAELATISRAWCDMRDTK